MAEQEDSEHKWWCFWININWKRELTLIVVGGIIGGLVFTAISPFLVPWIHDKQVNVLGAQNPTLAAEVEYAGDVPPLHFSAPGNETYDRYRIIIRNPSDKTLRTVTIGLAFPGGIDGQEVGHLQAEDATSYSGFARLANTQEIDNMTLFTNAIRISELPPGKVVTATFLIDTTPEEGIMPGYWETQGLDGYDASNGTIMMNGQFRWEFKGSVYTESKQYTLIEASERNTPFKSDLCIGDEGVKYCA